MKYSRDQIKALQVETAQGALFLIDNIGKQPPGSNFRQFTDQAISEHLRRHSYFYQKKNDEKLTLVDLSAMRRRVRDLWSKNKNAHTCDLQQLKGDDVVDAIFRKGSTKIFQSELLRISYKYDRTTFSEFDLPGDVESTSQAEGNEDSDSQAEAEIGQKGKQLENEEGVAGPHPRVVVKTLSRRAAAPLRSPTRDSDTSFKPMQDESGELSSDDGNIRYFVANEDISNKDDSRAQIEAEAAATLSTKFNPGYVEKVKSEAEESDDELGRDRFEVEIAATSPTKVNPALIRGVKRGAEEIEDISAEAESPPKKRGRPRKHPMDASTQPARVSPPPGADASRVSQQTSYMISTLAMQEVPIPRTATPFKPTTPTFVSQRQRLPVNGKEAIQSQVRTWVGTAKRKRGDVDFDEMINSGEDDTAVRPTKRKDNKLALKLGLKPGHLNAAQTSAAPSPKPAADTSAPIVIDATPEKEYPKGAQPTVPEVRDSQSSPEAASSHDTEPKHQPAAPPSFNAEEQARSFEKFYRMIEVATDKVIASIGDIGGAVSSLDPKPSDRLEALHTRSWGSQWEAERVRLTKDYVFTVPEVVMSLTSAFLFDNVFNQHASVLDIQAKLSGLKGATGRAILRMLDLKNESQRLADIVRTIESEDAIVRLAQNEEILQAQLHEKAEKYTQELWSIILPYFRSLSTLAEIHGLSSNRPEQDWQEVFTSAFTDLIEAILRFRLELLATGCQHEYTWPDAGCHYDLREMESHGAKMQLPLQVMFTVFPGLKVLIPGTDTMRALTGTKAMAKLRKVGGGG